ncbi:hypothetical protein M436DRAFT_71869 [Aureobasidium namibiae CBS 147.97]|uniref:Uncharacterized protein n=1 Tax=Aureobasidium namibiae CBS 147.97 TaxID=1043004 RepID=A0A074WMU7_9PEZI
MASQDGLFGRSLLCQPILKFSHSTLPRTASPSGWNHIQASDLFALIEQLDHNDIQLRIVHGTNDLETLPLTAIIQETKEIHRRHPEQSHESLPIFGLTKGTALAVRYFCQNDQIRRIQLRFADDASCNKAVRLLSSHGLMFSMQHTKQVTHVQARPVTANSYMNRQASVQSARFDRETSSIIVPTVQDAFQSTTSYEQQQSSQHTNDLANSHMFTSSPGLKVYQTTNITRQPTFAPIRTSVEPTERPSTAPIEWPSDMTRKMLPPRRELPWPKPSSSPAKTEMLPPLPKPSYASEATKPDQPMQERASSRASPETKVHAGITRLTTPHGPTRFEPPASRMYNFQLSDDSMTVDSETPRYGNAAPSTLSPEMKQDTIASSDRLHRSSASPVHFTGYNTIKETPLSPERSTYSSPDQMSSSSPSERRSERLAQKHSQQNPEVQDVEMTTADSPQQSAQDVLKQYAEQPDETRKKAIEQFILASIEDDNFLELCVDVEACWQRQLLDRRIHR